MDLIPESDATSLDQHLSPQTMRVRHNAPSSKEPTSSHFNKKTLTSATMLGADLGTEIVTLFIPVAVTALGVWSLYLV